MVLPVNKIKERVLAIFGGREKVAEICGVTPSAVSQWGIIPARHQLALLTHAKSKRIKIDPNVFYAKPKSQFPINNGERIVNP